MIPGSAEVLIGLSQVVLDGQGVMRRPVICITYIALLRVRSEMLRSVRFLKIVLPTLERAWSADTVMGFSHALDAGGARGRGFRRERWASF
ncbi:hypothetical protein GCM10010151_04990 [Actinoallomurus spadix]|uniref:Transposase n=1 Tax=Actinoallomurus spadix TaxID=79912 RepID=A0ABN0VVA2_9ACTN